MRRRIIDSPRDVLADALTIYWATDSHVYDRVDGDPNADGAISVDGVRYFYAGRQRLEKFVSDANANADVAIHGGDLVEGDVDDFALFQSAWSGLAVPNELTIGNHDCAKGRSSDDVAAILGYDNRPKNGGSHFQRAFPVSNGKTSALIVMMDTNFGPSGGTGGFHPDALAWLDAVLDETEERLALVFCHHHPHTSQANHPPHNLNYMVPEDAIALRNLLRSKRQQRGIASLVLGGHWHGIREMRTWGHLGTDVLGLSAPCIVDYEVGSYMVLHVWQDGSFLGRRVATNIA